MPLFPASGPHGALAVCDVLLADTQPEEADRADPAARLCRSTANALDAVVEDGAVLTCALKGREPEEGELEPLAMRAWQAGRRITGEQALWGFQTLRLMSRQILARFVDHDVFLCPVLGTDPPRVEEIDPLTLPLKDSTACRARPSLNPPFNVSGQRSV